jgi:hypothetical protein
MVCNKSIHIDFAAPPHPIQSFHSFHNFIHLSISPMPSFPLPSISIRLPSPPLFNDMKALEFGVEVRYMNVKDSNPGSKEEFGGE